MVLSNQLPKRIEFKTNDESWDIRERGLMVFDFRSEYKPLLENIIYTAELFTATLYTDIPEFYKEKNRIFMRDYIGIPQIKRKINRVDIPVEMIKPGDTFHIIRGDGMGPMIAWAMGSSTSHMSVAQYIHGGMHVCESTASRPDWPVNGIQCTPYAKYMNMMHEAGETFVWAPLDPKIPFDNDASVKFVETVLGVDYGFEVLLTEWIDTVNMNYPCRDREGFPWSQRNICMDPHIMEILFTWLERHFPHAARIWD